ncbi:MAG: hypothetical protein OEW39_07930 [Deltaproteobacteria bacterium]|nr:hypothetical protein [Deltaproteobacteria bacterium]
MEPIAEAEAGEASRPMEELLEERGSPQWRWAAARLLFHVYLGFALFTLVGGFLTFPVLTWYIFGDWRFWRHIGPAARLLPHGWIMVFKILKGENGGYMLDVPLTSPPFRSPPTSLARLRRDWGHGASCGGCRRCCEKIACPVLDSETGLCRGYQSFFWRYFNCGRFPTQQRELTYYECPKWELQPTAAARQHRRTRAVQF